MKQSDITVITDKCYVNTCYIDEAVFSNMICTTCDSLIPQGSHQPSDQNKVTLYNCVAESFVTIDTNKILHITVENKHNLQKNNAHYSTKISIMKQEIERAVEKCTDLDKSVLTQILQRVGVDIFHILTVFNHTVSHENIIHGNINGSQLETIIEGWIDEIRDVRNNNLLELDQLVNEARDENASDDDLQDIEQIKQLYRDIPQDIDRAQFKTVEDVVSFWPPLCMPMPEELKECKRYIMQDRHNSDNNFKQQTDEHVVEQLLQNITDQPGLNGILEEMRAVPGTPPRVITAVKNRLKQLV